MRLLSPDAFLQYVRGKGLVQRFLINRVSIALHQRMCEARKGRSASGEGATGFFSGPLREYGQEQKARLLDAPGLDGVVLMVEGSGALFGVEEGLRSAQPALGRAQMREMWVFQVSTQGVSFFQGHLQWFSREQVGQAPTKTPKQ